MLLTSVDTGRGRVGGGRGPFIKDRINFSKNKIQVMTGTFNNVTSFKVSLQRYLVNKWDKLTPKNEKMG